MNIWGKTERSWRRKNRRAVSPIIATILLVAITVVLAAVLYILISQYTKSGASSVTIGTALAIGSTTDGSSGTGAAAINYYNATIESTGPTLSWGSFLLEVKSPTGTVVAIGTLVGGVAVSALVEKVVSPPGNVAACYALGAATVYSPAVTATATCGATGSGVGCTSPAFASACSSTSIASTVYTISVQVSGTAAGGAPSLTGYSLVALGQGSFSGTTSGTIT